jgi:hypothetical protein
VETVTDVSQKAFNELANSWHFHGQSSKNVQFGDRLVRFIELAGARQERFAKRPDRGGSLAP